MSTHEVVPELAPEPRPEQRRVPPLLRSVDALTWICIGVVVLLVLVGIGQTYLDYGGAEAVGYGPRFAPPEPGWGILGTDHLGRAVLPRLLGSIAETFAIAVPPSVIAALAASVLACLAAYSGGWIDLVLSRAVDVLFTFPAILLALLMVSIVGPSTAGALVSIALIVSPQVFRVIRTRAKEVVPREFVNAARVSGANALRIVFVHLLPNVLGAIVVQTTFAIVLGILVESSLSFLGLGVTPPTASLGSLVHDGYPYLTSQPVLVFGPAAVLGLTIFAINVVGDWVRDALEVRDTAVLS